MNAIPKKVQASLQEASVKASHGLFTNRTAGKQFVSTICSDEQGAPDEWDRFIEETAARSYAFLLEALGPFQKEPLPEIWSLSDAAHSAGANASFEPGTGRIRLSPSIVRGNPGITMEKVTHELLHASLAAFPEGEAFYEEGYVDYSVWVLAHAPIWGANRKGMIEAADFNIRCRRDRAMRDLSDYDRKRWAGGLFCATMHGPWIISKLKLRKVEGDLRW